MWSAIRIRILPCVSSWNFLGWIKDLRDSQLEVEDVSTSGEDAQGAEDEISEPEEDSLTGQMAIMRGGSVKNG